MPEKKLTKKTLRDIRNHAPTPKRILAGKE
jgi:hypothetical protein